VHWHLCAIADFLIPRLLESLISPLNQHRFQHQALANRPKWAKHFSHNKSHTPTTATTTSSIPGGRWLNSRPSHLLAR